MRLKATKIIKGYNKETKMLSVNKNIFVTEELLLEEERIGYMNELSSTMIYHITTSEEKLVISLKSYTGIGSVIVRRSIDGVINDGKNGVDGDDVRDRRDVLVNIKLTYNNKNKTITFPTNLNNEYSTTLDIQIFTNEQPINIPFIYKLQINKQNTWTQINPNKDILFTVNEKSESWFYLPVYSEYDMIGFDYKEMNTSIGINDNGFADNKSIEIWFKYKIVDPSKGEDLIGEFTPATDNNYSYNVQWNAVTRVVSSNSILIH